MCTSLTHQLPTGALRRAGLPPLEVLSVGSPIVDSRPVIQAQGGLKMSAILWVWQVGRPGLLELCFVAGLVRERCSGLNILLLVLERLQRGKRKSRQVRVVWCGVVSGKVGGVVSGKVCGVVW